MIVSTARSAALLLLMMVSPALHAQVSVVTAQNDNNRTAANLSESTLTTSNVNVNQFGKIFSRAVDGYIYAQPLYVPNVTIGGGVHNVVYVATMNNSVYAFDADDPNASTPLWQVSLGTAVPATATYLPNDQTGGLAPTSGILSTPVIDPSSGTLYAVALVLQSNTPVYQLHAIDLLTGAEKPNSPVVIQGSYTGTGPAIAFDAHQHLQRTGLLLSNGNIYFGFASYSDIDPYYGWIFGYNASTLQQTAIQNLAPGGRGGVWQSGGGLSADANGFVYVCTGNGTWDGVTNFGESCVKLDPSQGLAVVDYFTPYNYDPLNASDSDLGAGRALLIPGTNYLVTGGKQSLDYVLDRNNLGQISVGDTNVVQRLISDGRLFSGMAYWNNPASPFLYLWSSNDELKAYRLTGGLFDTTPASASTATAPYGTGLSVSANGGTAGSGIVWATTPSSPPGSSAVPGTVHAFDASNVSVELWNSDQNSGRDSLGNLAKFAAPTVANGKVYVPTFSNQLVVYGTLSTAPQTISPSSATLGAAQVQQFSSNTQANFTIVPSLGTVSSNGLYTAPTSVPTQQTVAVTATNVSNSSQQATATVTLIQVSISVNPPTVGLFGLQTQQFTATVLGSNNTAVTWSIGPTDPGSISAGGLYTAPASIGSSQTVTVTATSVADNTKTASATVTLNPPAVPVIVVGPKSLSVFTGATASFSVTAAGAGLTYQWQSMAAGAGSFTNISGATSSSYTTPVTTLADDGTQFRCVVTNAQGSATSSAATMTVLASGSTFLITEKLGTTRNDFSGFVGLAVTTGSTPMSVSALGRFVAPGNSGTHTVKIVDGTTGNDIAGASVSINLTGVAPGTFAYRGLPVPATLAANTTYFVLSQETVGGDLWYDFTATTAVTTTDALLSGAIYGPPYAYALGSVGHVYVPVDFIYRAISVAPATATLYASQTQQFTAALSGLAAGVTWTISPVGVGSISASGLYTAPSLILSSQTVTVTATSVADPTKSASAAVTLNPVAVNVTPPTASLFDSQTQQFAATVTNNDNTAVTWTINPPGAGSISTAGLYAAPTSVPALQTVTVIATSVADNTKSGTATITLNPPAIPAITLQPQDLAVMAGQAASFSVLASGGGLSYQWQSMAAGAGSFSNISGATLPVYAIASATLAQSGTQFRCVATNVHGTAISNSVVLTVLAPGIKFVTAVTPGTLRNDYSGWVGMNIVVGPAPVIVNSLGRMVAPGNTGAHTVKIVDANGNDLPGAAVQVATAGATAGTFVYGALQAPVVLTGGNSYSILTQETAGGDQFYNSDTSAQTVGAALLNGPEYGTGAPFNFIGDTVGNMFGPVDFSMPISIGVAPSTATLTNGQTQQFGATVTGNDPSVTWTINPNVGSISVDGIYTTPNSIASNQSITVTATSVADITKTATATVTLTPVTVSVTPVTASLFDSQTQQFTATIGNSNNPAVTWSISPAGAGSISAAGLYTAPGSIATTQTVSVIATSVADNTKTGTATVTLNSPVAPVITLQPQNLAVMAGQAASFTVAATGGGLFYQWQSMAPGAGSFSNISGATSPLYTISSASLTQSGTQIRCVVTNIQGAATSNAVVLTVVAPGIKFVTSATLLTLRNDFTGWVGMNLVVGPTPLILNSLGRMVAPGNTGTHTVKIVDAATAIDVPGGAVSVNTAGATPGTFTYGALQTPIVLNASSNYLILSQETSGGDQFYDDNTVAQTLNVALLNGPEYGADSTSYNFIGATVGKMFGPVDFSMPISISVAPTSGSLVDGQTLQFSATVTGNDPSVAWSISPNIGSISAGGLYTPPALIPANQTITVTATSLADITKSASASVTLNLPAPPTITLQPHGTAVSPGEAASFSVAATSIELSYQWQSAPPGGNFTNIAGATSSSFTTPLMALADSGTQFQCVVTNRVGSATSSPATVTVINAGTDFITSTTPFHSRNDFTGWVGMSVTIGNSSVIVDALSRAVLAGNTGLHSLKIVDAATGNDIPGAVTSVDTTTGAPGSFVSGTLPVSVTLNANATYYILSQETLGGDTWYDSDTQASTDSHGALNGPVYGVGAPYTLILGSAGQTFGPVSFHFVSVDITPSAVVVSSSQTQQFTAVGAASGAGVSWSISPSVGTISASGLYTAPSVVNAIQVITVTATSLADSNLSGTATITLSGITQQPQDQTVFAGQTASFSVVSTGSGLTYQWKSKPAGAGSFTAIPGAASSTYTTPPATVADSGTQFQVDVNTTQGLFTSHAATLTVLSAGSTFLTSSTPGTLRNNYTGSVGMSVTVGPNPLVVTSLGRMVAPGNSGTHTLKLVDAATGIDIPNGAVSINTAGATAGSFLYGALPTPLTLSANASYYVLSLETQGGDKWYDHDTIVQTTNDATLSSAVQGPPYVPVAGSANNPFGPVDFTYISLAVNPATATLGVSQTQQFGVNATGVSNAVNWNISPAVGSISATGLYTAPALISSTQTVTVTATSQVTGLVSATATITLLPVQIGLTPSGISLSNTQTQQYTATVTNSADSSVTWTINPNVGSISAAGLYTAPAVIPTQQTVTITATSNVDNTKFANVTVTLLPLQVALAPPGVTLTGTQTQQYTATVTNSAGTSVAWTINPNVGSISATGLYTAPAVILTQQTVTITATSNVDNTKSASVQVTLLPISISTAPPAATLVASQTQQFTATVTNGVNTSVTWSITPSGTGSISAAGLYTPPVLIATVQTVTVTATSVADGTKTASSTITLNPDPPAITQQPAGVTVYEGAAPGGFTVAASGLNLTYQWQSMPPGGGSFTNIAGATTPSFTPAVPVLADSGTQFRCVVSNPQGFATSSPATLTVLSAGATFITSVTTDPNHIRNDFTGSVGMLLQVGPTPLTVRILGRMVLAGNTGTHTLKLVDGDTGVDIPGGSVTVDTTTGTPGAYLYGALQNPVILAANASYFVVSQETVGGDQWFDKDTSAQTTGDAALLGAVFTTGGTTYTDAPGSFGHMYGPVDFKYVAMGVLPTTASLYASQTQQFTAVVTGIGSSDVNWSLTPPSAGTISAAGLYTAPSLIPTGQTVTVTSTSAADPTKSASATITLVPVTISLAPLSVQLFPSQTQQFTATVAGTNNPSVIWTMNPIVGTLSAAGLYTAPASIAANQNLTITATSAADGSKIATASILLSPPAPPVITQQPANVSVDAGQNAVFDVEALGPGLSYQWQSMAPGASTFTNIAGETQHFTITPVTTVADNGTQFQVVITNIHGTLTSNAAVLAVAPAPTPIITSTTLGSIQNDFTGWVGMSMTTGNLPVTVRSLGRIVGLNNTAAHNVKIVDATTGIDVPGATALVPTAGLTQGTYSYTALASPVVLNPNATYYVVSQETLGGEAWYDSTTAVQTTSAGVVNGPVYGNGTTYNALTLAGHLYVPVNFTYSIPVSISVNPTTATLFGTQTQQFSATVVANGSTAVTWSVSPSGAGTVDSTGLYTAPASVPVAQTVSVTATSVTDITKSASATVTLNPPAPPIITQNPQNATALVGQTATFSVTASGIGLTYQWQSMVSGAGSFSNISGANASSYTTPTLALADNGTQFRCVVTNAQGSVFSNSASLTVISPGNPFVTSKTLGLLRNNFTGWVGMQLTTGSSGLVVTSLGRIVAPGNTAAHTVKIVDGTTNLDVPGASVSINTAGGTSGAFLYATLPAPIALNANAAYFILSQETSNADQWYDNNSVITTTSDAALTASAYGTVAPFTPVAGSAGKMYVPVDFKYNLAVSVNVTPPTISLYASQTQQFNATVTGNSNTAVTWSINPSNVGSISASGFYTAPASIPAGTTVTVMATSVADVSKSASATVTLQPVALTVNPATLSMYRGQVQQFTAAVTGNNNTSVTWAINPSGAGSISANGLYTAPASILTAQTVTVTATSVADNTKFGSATVTLQPVAVAVAPPTASLFDSQTQQFAATITGATDTSVTWTITPSGAGSISAAGLYTAPAPIVATQTVTVTATSGADNTKSATATITLNPPAAPVITQQPQALTTFTGQTATFTVGAIGGGLSYDWQSKAPGASAFVDIGGGVTNTYTTPATTPADNGTQFRVIVSNGQGLATSNPVTMNVALPGLNFLSSYTLGAFQNDFTGWVGMSVTIGPNPISVNSIGRIIAPGNVATHALKIVDASTGLDVPGATASINTLGGTAGTIVYGFLPSPVTLNANGTYYILSQEIHDGEFWYDSTTTAQSASVGAINGPVYGAQAPYTAFALAGHLYVPVDFTYTAPISVGVAPATADLFGGQTQQFAPVIGGTSYNAVTWTISPSNAGSITDSGLYTAPGSIPAVQTVTVTATSAADITKSGTATVTLHPPLPPSITQGPQNTMAVTAQTATFTVTAVGGGLTYQWQSMAPGAGVFTNVGGPLSSYTTPPTALTDGGTQIRCIVTNSQGSVTSNVATLTVVDLGVNFVTSVTLGNQQNDFTGWVGMQITVGPAPMIITSLGRAVGPGSSGVHTVKIVNAATGIDMPGGFTSIGTLGDTPGTFVYSRLASPVTLSANTAYYILSQEVQGGDTFFDSSSIAQTTSAAVINGPVYGPPYSAVSTTGSLYGPLDFTYTIPVSVNVTPTTASLFNSQTQQFAATIISAGSSAVTWTLNPNVGTISNTGLYTAPPSITTTQSVTVTATSVEDTTKAASATVTLNPPAPPVITQQPQNAAAVAGQNGTFNVTATGLNLSYQWQSMAPGAGSFTNIAGALSSSYVTPATALADNGTQFQVVVTNAQGSITSNPAFLSVLTPGSPFVTSTVLGTLRNNYAGPVGMEVTVGSKPLVVSSVGRIVVAGNTGVHTMKIIDAATGTQLASASVATAGGTAGAFAYANLVSPVTFNANASYYIVSLETLGGDQWYENNTTAQTTADAALAGAVYGDTSSYTAIPMPGRMYVPVDFKYVVSSSVSILPTATTLSASQTQQFTGTVNGSGNASVTWSLSPNVGSLSASGLYTAPAFIAATQTVTVTATSVADPTKSASATVTLAPISVILGPPTASLFATQTQQFTPTVIGSTNTAVTWSTNPNNVGSISGTGLYTAPASVASTQTVTVTAFSVADSSKFATATITLNPPAPPVITQAPQNTSVPIGQTATFTVTTTGVGISYQWQSMPSGGSFSNIGAATSSSYTTPVLSLADSGTQFRVVVTNPQGSVTSSAATVTVQPAGLTLVTSQTLGTIRNNYTGWVGMKITVGTSPMTVTSLGRIVGPGNSAAHTVKIVDAVTGNDVAGASASVATLGGTPGTFVYSSLASPVTLNANAAYYLVSQETAGGDQWYDNDTTLQTTSVAAITAPAYGLPFATAGSAGHSYVPVDLKYSVSVSVSVTPTTASLFDSQTQQFAATVGGTSNQSVTWTLSPNLGTISAAGLYTAPAPITTTQLVTVIATSVADVTKSGTATVTLNPPSPPVITQQPQNATAIAGGTGSFSVTASGLGLSYQWQNMAPGAASFTNIAGALSSSYTTPSVAFSDSGTQFRVVVTNAQGSATSNAATLSVLSPGTPFITSLTLGSQRNDFTGWVGMNITVGPAPLIVSSLGRIVVAGNNHGHYLKIVDAITGNDLATAAMATLGGTPGTFVYGNLATPITLNANASYLILSQEENQVDQWYDNTTVALTTTDAAIVGSTYGTGAPYRTYTNPGHVYVPVDFKYAVSAAVNINPTAATISAAQTQQFTSTVAGGVTWSLNPNVGSISASGLYSPPATIASTQTVTVTATSLTDNTKSASATVTLVPVVVTVTPLTTPLFASQTQQFTATVTGASNTSVNWTINPNVGTISAAGLYTAPSSIASAQTVTVKATSVADNTKLATATVTLNPPSPPIITQAPQNAAVFSGQTANFTVTANGLNLTYQWQSMAPGAGSFTNISGATSTSYTTPSLTLADNGTQVQVVVTNPQGSVTSSAATLSVLQAGVTLVTSETLGTSRNNYTGWVGMKITVGASPVTVSALGRIVGPGNNAAHIVKIVDASTGNDVSGGSASVTTAGGTTGTFAYGALGSPVTLNANASYYIVSQETAGGDQWYDLDTVVQTTAVATVNGPVYGTPYSAFASAGHSYVPVDLKYNVSVSVSVAPPTASLFDSQTQQFTATVSGAGNTAVTWTLNPNVGSISTAGLYTAPAPITTTQTITVTATSVADVTKSATATVTLNPPSPPAITQAPQNTSVVVGQTGSFSVTASGLGLSYQWQSMTPGAGSFTNIAGATSSSYTTPATALADGGTQFRVVVTNSQGSATSAAATLSVLSPGTAFVTSVNLGVGRNDYSGFVGMKLIVGSNALVVSSLGRYVAPLNTQAHTVVILDAATGIQLGTASVATAGVTAGTFAYANLASPVTLSPNAIYYIMSQETQGGDGWYDNTTTAQTTTDATLMGSVYGVSWPYITHDTAGRMYVPVSFKYIVGSLMTVAPTTATLTASQTQQFTATISSGNSAVTWSLNPNVGSISSTGLYTAPVTIASAQSVTVIATSVADNTKTASATVNLTPVSVSLAPGTTSLFGGQTQQFTPTVNGTSNTSVTWTINPNVGSISTSGLYTAPASITSAQTITVTATSAADNTKTGSATVTLVPVAVSVAPPAASLFASQTQQFTATVTGATNTSVTWSIGPTDPGSISGTGLYTAPSSIATTQTVTVTATSVADNTKLGTATVTLNPPLPPSITQQPQAATAMTGQTATFSVTASGLNLSYQWQSMASGAGSFSNIGGATSSSYTTPATAASDSGTQFRCVVTNPQGSATSNPATLSVQLAGVNFVTSQTPGTDRNNYSGWVGMTITVGSSPMTVSSIGRFIGLHNSQTHTVKIVDASNSTDVASTSVSTTGAAPGTFVYGNLSSPVILTANHVYYVVSQETAGADDWYDADSVLQTTSAATVNGPVYGVPYAAAAQPGHTYVMLDLKYTVPVSVSVGPTTASLFPNQTQQFTATVGGTSTTSVTWSLNPNVGTVSAAGLYTAPGSIASTQSVTVIATSVADNTKSGSATVTLNPPTPPAITQQPQSVTTLVGQTATFSVTASGMGLSYQWQSMPSGGSFNNISGATSSSYTTPLAALADNGTQFQCVVTNAQGSATSNAATLTVSNATTFVTSKTLGTLRSNYSGWLGAKITVGNASMIVGALGRIVAPGNTGTHTVKIVNATTGADIASVTVATAGGTSGTFVYTALATPITLSANTAYYILSQEGQNGEAWYDTDTTVTTTSDAVDSGSIYGTVAPYNLNATPGHMYVPVDFKYALGQ